MSQIDENIGKLMYDLMGELFPICRSITGNGVRQTLEIIKKHIPLDIHEVSTGTQVFDWTIPKEWNIDDAYVVSPSGEKIIDFKKSNLHILNYSIPIKGKIKLDKLKEHLFTLPDQPDLIPYRTSYYTENWGFCLKHNDFLKLEEGEYDVFIDSTLTEGSLTYGEFYIKGSLDEEILISCYVCHPSMCNDSLSGVVLATFLAKHLSSLKNRYSFRFLFIPETIGAITWLSKNTEKTQFIKHGLVITCAGDSGNLTYKKSRKGDAEIDRVAKKVLTDSKSSFQILDFFPTGSDERQFCSPGFNLPVGSLVRSLYLKFPEYHTSGDNLSFVNAKSLMDSYEKYMEIIFVLEHNGKYINKKPMCEPQLGKYDLYNLVGGDKNSNRLTNQFVLLWILNMSDGTNDLLDISEKSGYMFREIIHGVENLQKVGLIELM